MSGSFVGSFDWWNAGLWLAQALLALVYLYAGIMKVSRSPDGLAELGWTWAPTMPPAFLRLLGIAEILGAFGVVMPVAMHILPVLTPVAALGLTVMQVAAIILHGLRGETATTIPLNLALLAASLFVSWGRTQ
jgi:uncharacterized membrane protein YphA (DoxX/SURF4 family)